LATGDKAIKFWKVKVKVGGEVCALLNALPVYYEYRTKVHIKEKVKKYK